MWCEIFKRQRFYHQDAARISSIDYELDQELAPPYLQVGKEVFMTFHLIGKLTKRHSRPAHRKQTWRQYLRKTEPNLWLVLWFTTAIVGPTSQSYAMVIGSSSTRTSPNFSHVVVILSYFSKYFSLMQQVIRMTKEAGGMTQLKKRVIKTLVLFILPSNFIFFSLNRKLPNFTWNLFSLICPISNLSAISTTLNFQTISWGTQRDHLKWAH